MADFDAKTPSMARVYDSLLGGKDNFQSDRDAAMEFLSITPEISVVAAENRQFLSRAVTWMAGQGIAQFLDLGCGTPLSPNTHESAKEINPAARVAYVDMDPVAVGHMGTFARPGSGVVAIEADVRDLAATRAALGDAIDFTQPVGVLMGTLLHFYDGDRGRELVTRYTSDLVPGSYLVASTMAPGGELTDRFIREYSAAVAPVRTVPAAELTEILGGLEIIPPGVADLSTWRPDWPDVPEGKHQDFHGHGALARVV